MNRHERRSWNLLLQVLELTDCHGADEIHNKTDKLFSWENGRNGDERRTAKLDRFYCSREVMEDGGDHTILPHFRHLSDHAPVILKLPPQLAKGKTRRGRFDPALLKIPRFKQELIDEWRSVPIIQGNESKLSWLAMALDRVRNKAIRISSSLKNKRSVKERRALGKLKAAEAFLARYLRDEGAVVVLDNAQSELEEVTRRDLERHQHEMAALWCTYGDKCSQNFFNFHKNSQHKVHILELIVDGRQVTTQQRKLEEARFYFKQVYIKESQGKEVSQARDQVWAATPTIVTTQQNTRLLESFTRKELKEAVLSLEGSVSPGSDGIPPEFIQQCFGEVEEALMGAALEALEGGELPERIN